MKLFILTLELGILFLIFCSSFLTKIDIFHVARICKSSFTKMTTYFIGTKWSTFLKILGDIFLFSIKNADVPYRVLFSLSDIEVRKRSPIYAKPFVKPDLVTYINYNHQLTSMYEGCRIGLTAKLESLRNLLERKEFWYCMIAWIVY